MATMTTASTGGEALESLLSRSGEWTVEDLGRLPDDGHQYELLDGMLLVTPGPVVAHQAVMGNLFFLLKTACPPGMMVLFAPMDWQPDRRTSLQPDILVMPPQRMTTNAITDRLLLAAEVLSPSTRRKDLLLKRSKYEEAGVPSYWLLDPQEPTLTVLELRDGTYVTTAEVKGDDTVRLERPFAVEITPSALLEP